jgi:hypothetical protein
VISWFQNFAFKCNLHRATLRDLMTAGGYFLTPFLRLHRLFSNDGSGNVYRIGMQGGVPRWGCQVVPAGGGGVTLKLT